MIRNQADVIRERPHYRLQKTTLGVASVLLGTTLYFGGVAHADTDSNVNKEADVTAVTNIEDGKADSSTLKQTVVQNQPHNEEDRGQNSPVNEPVNSSENEQTTNSQQSDLVKGPDGNEPNLQVVDAQGQQKQLTRTINITNPINGDITKQVQTVTYRRDNETSPWETVGSDTFPEFSKIPHYPGWEPYDADGGNAVMDGKVLAVNTTPNMSNLIVNVAYRQTDGHAVLELKDKTTGEIVNTQNYIDHYGNKQKIIKVDIPDGYKLADGETIPKEILVANNNKVIVNVEPIVVHLTNNESKTMDDLIPGTKNRHFPKGLLKDDLNRSISRTFILKYPDGTSKKVVQGPVEFTRDATVNAVTGRVEYGEWSNNGSYTFPKFDIPSEPNMLVKPTAYTGAMTVTPDYLSIEVPVEYQYKAASQKIKFIDVADAGKANPEALDEKTYTGRAGEVINTNDLVLPAGYELAKGQSIPKSITLKADHVTPINIVVQERHVKVTADDPKDNGDEIPGTDGWCWYPSGVAKNDLNKTITRTVNIYEPDHDRKPTTSTQSVHLTRDAVVGAISGDVQYGDWSTGSWAAIEIPQFKGYTADVKRIGDEPVTDGTNDVKIDVHYVKNDPQQLNDQKNITQTIKYVFADGKPAGDDHVVTKTITRSGLKDAVTDVITWNPWIKDEFTAVETPALRGYTPDKKLVPSAMLDDNQTVTVTYTKNAPKVDIENRDFTRTIKYVFADGQPAGDDIVQISNWQRKIYTDAVTGEKAYDDWLNVNMPEYMAVNTKVLHGYTADKTIVKSVHAKPENSVVTVTYTKNPDKVVHDQKNVKQTVYFVNTDGQTLHDPNVQSVTLHREGHQDAVTDEITWGDWDKVNFVEVNAPAFHGYTADNSSIKATPATSDKAFTITYTKNSPVVVNDQKSVTRTINFVDGHGNKLDDPVVQTVNLIRIGSKDAVTDEITWGDWSKVDFTKVEAPRVKGYTPKMGTIKTQLATDNVTINDVYALNPMIDVSESRTYTRTINYNFVDHYTELPTVTQKSTVTRNGKKNPATDEITWGKWSEPSFEAVKSPLVHGYTPDEAIVNSSNKPGNTVVTINYKRDLDQEVMTQQHVTQIIKYVFADGKSAHPDDVQTFTRTRTGVEDAVTDEIKWNDWENDQYKDVQSPEIHGYTADISIVKGSAADCDKTVVVTYSKNAPEKVTDQKTVTRHIKYVFSNGKQASDPVSQTVTLLRHGLKDAVSGKIAWDNWSTGSFEIVKSPEIQGYTPSQTSVTSVHADKNVDVTVTYTKKAPMHVTDHKKITRTIKYEFMDGKSAGKTIEQTAEITREGSKDAVTGEVAWGSWSKGHFASVKSPEVHGYGASVKTVKDLFSDHDENVVVKYSKQADKEVTDHKTVTRTINYVFDDGKKALDSTKQTVQLSRVGFKDSVTDEISWGNWTTEVFTSVKAPEIHGYTADQPVIDAGQANGDVTVTVHYQKNDSTKVADAKKVTRTIKYVFADGKQVSAPVIQTVELTRTGERDAVTGDITWGDWGKGQFEKVNSPVLHGYTADRTFVGSSVAKIGDDQAVTVTYTKNAPEKVTDQKVLSQTIRYQFENGVPAHENHVQTVLVKRTGEKDAVSGEVSWGPWDDVCFKAVKSPEIDGYKPDVKEVDAVEATGNTDTDLLVTYHKIKGESSDDQGSSDKLGKDIHDTDVNDDHGKPDSGDQKQNVGTPDTHTLSGKSDMGTNDGRDTVNQNDNGRTNANKQVNGSTSENHVNSSEKKSSEIKTMGTSGKSEVMKTNERKLPQTGADESETKTGVLGLLAGGLTAMFGLKKKREEK